MSVSPAPDSEMRVVRPALEADLERISTIYAHYALTHLATFETIAPSIDEMRARFHGLVAEGFPYLVAEHDGRVRGFAYGGPFRARIGFRYTVEDSIYLDPTMIGHGIGGVLLDRLIAACTDRGFRQMVAVIGDSANLASIRLHARRGFAMVGTLPAVGFKLGRWVDSVLMQRALGPGEAALPR
jgi:L-amino acid N-acyltransferase YncA